ncbi:Murein tetrapeptide carboxypeptidase [Halomonadaceae bacterium LMG 33818]|uniref:LD-carboxypeptidase n=1 Tax=Cernens ardua TaxID=3402176 RepID=UPI003EDC44C9
MMPSLWKTPKTVALVSPAGATPPEKLQKTLHRLEQLGVSAFPSAHVGARKRRYLAGSIEDRLEDLYTAFERDDIDAVWCVRGGYGSAQLISHIDWQRLSRAKDIPLIGYSDITALLIAFHKHGLKAIHGPVANEVNKLDFELSDEALVQSEGWQSLASVGEVLNQHQGILPTRDSLKITTPTPLLGGNLTVLASLCGTQGALQPSSDYFLLIEDVNEAFYHLERSFFQLIESLDKSLIKGIGLGEFVGCDDPDKSLTIKDLFADWIKGAHIPMFEGLPIGHGQRNHAWHYGAFGTIEQNMLRWMS